MLPLVIIPFLRKAYEKAIEKTAEKTIETVALKLHTLIEKLKKKPNDQKLHQELDLLIPINWKELDKELRITGSTRGLSTAEAKRMSAMLVQDLQDDKVLIGDMLIHVSRITVTRKH